MQLIDIGVNLTNQQFENDIDDILLQAQEVGVTTFIITGTNIEHSHKAVQLCQLYPHNFYCTAGIHPHDAKQWDNESITQLEELLSNPCVRAVGETGLDFNRNFSTPEQQVDVFQHQLELAASCQKPAFLHQRDAFDTFYNLLREYRHKLSNAVAHCFTDNKQALYKLLDVDCHIGITGWICDAQRGQELRELVKHIPSNRLMLETDAPYLLPKDLQPKPKSRTNYPKYLPHILTSVAHYQQKQPFKLAEEVFGTTQSFFNLHE